MSDINLLPDDLRQKEREQFDNAKGQKKDYPIVMSEPLKEKPVSNRLKIRKRHRC